MSTRSGDIRDQSRKLSEIEPKFGRFLPSRILGGGTSENCTHVYHHCFAPRRPEKFHQDIPTSPEVIGVHTLNFKPNCTFSRLQFFGGFPVPVGMCDSKAWLISSACKKIEGAAPFKGRTIVSRKMSTWVGQYAPL